MVASIVLPACPANALASWTGEMVAIRNITGAGEIGRDIVGPNEMAGALLRPSCHVEAQAAPFSFLLHSL
jgi:hypothetical protein